jgi:ribonuclease BN (tRNA processing enzyme)
VAVRLEGQIYLFDAGEGCQVNLKKTKLGIKPLRVLAVSHLHGDHCLGVPGLLMMRAQVPDPGPLTILGPPGIQRFVEGLREVLAFYVNYSISFCVESPEVATRTGTSASWGLDIRLCVSGIAWKSIKPEIQPFKSQRWVYLRTVMECFNRARP